jgi:hypothetical protein
MKYDKNDVLLIEWLDSHHRPGWARTDDFDEAFESTSETKITTVGFFYKENKHFIAVIQSQDNQIDTEYDALMIIPKKAIVKISKLKTGR